MKIRFFDFFEILRFWDFPRFQYIFLGIFDFSKISKFSKRKIFFLKHLERNLSLRTSDIGCINIISGEITNSPTLTGQPEQDKIWGLEGNHQNPGFPPVGPRPRVSSDCLGRQPPQLFSPLPLACGRCRIGSIARNRFQSMLLNF